MKIKQLNDAALIQECLNDNKKGWKEFWKRHGKKVYFFPIWVLGCSKSDGDSFYHFVFDAIIKKEHFKSYEPNERFEPWLTSVLQQLFIDFLNETGSPLFSYTVKKKKKEHFSIIEQIKTIDKKLSNNCDLSATLGEFCTQINKLPNDTHMMLKLCQLPYFFFSNEELKLLKAKTKLNFAELLNMINGLREEATYTTNSKEILAEEKITDYINILHLEQQKLLVEQEVRTLEKEHNFDIALVDLLTTLNKQLKKANTQQQKRQNKLKSAGNISSKTETEQNRTIMGLTTKKADSILSQNSKWLTKIQEKQQEPGFETERILQLYAIYEKANLFIKQKKNKCPSQERLHNYLTSNHKIEPKAQQKIEKHLDNCAYCLAKLQMTMEFESCLKNRKKSNPPKKLALLTKQMINNLQTG